jgi:Flp pilus assembly protein CpaB
MLERKKLIQLVTAGVMALVFVQFYLKAREQNIEMGFSQVEVVVAASEIQKNTRITANELTTRRVAQLYTQPGSFVEKLPNETRKAIIGKVSLIPIPQGTQITQTMIASPTAKDHGVAPVLPTGKVGYPLRLGNLDVAKLIVPGNRINIMATFTVRERGSEQVRKATHVILQNIQVVAVATDILESGRDVSGKKQTTEGRVLTLALESNEAVQLSHAIKESGGDIDIAIRAQGDEVVRPIASVTDSTLLEKPAVSGTPAQTAPRAPTRR